MDYSRILEKINSASLQQGDAPTRALAVFNLGGAAYSGVVRFAAAFPVRASVGASPVVVRDALGVVVPSRLRVSELLPGPPLPPERLLWRMELEFFAADVPALGWRAFSATFDFSSESRSDDADFWQAQPPFAPEIHVAETDCHKGDLPLIGRFADS